MAPAPPNAGAPDAAPPVGSSTSDTSSSPPSAPSAPARSNTNAYTNTNINANANTDTYPPAADPLARVPLYPEEAAAAPTRVAVTGATGYVAGSVVARLLASGHTVHATVRNPDDAAATAALRALPGASERLRLFRADLMEAGSFDAAVEGCEFVLHTASPFRVWVPRGQERALLVEPALRGVEHVLAAVERSPSVRRVVMTSSVAAVLFSRPETAKPGRYEYDESHWNALAREDLLAYAYSKTAAERRAWELAGAQNRWSLVTLCPGLVLGPPLSSRADSESVVLFRRMLAGEMFPAAPWAGVSTVDVRDVAAAHCLAMVHPAASGRYLLVGDNTHVHSLARIAADAYPGGSLWPPLLFVPKWLVWLAAPLAGLPRDAVTYSLGYENVFDSSKVRRELGLRFTDLPTTVRDMVEDLAARKLSKHPKPSVAAVPTVTLGGLS